MHPPAIISSISYRCRVVLLAVGGFVPAVCFGSLTWESQQIHRTAKLGDKEVVALFNFRNTGANPVTIRDIRTSCACTVAELHKRNYSAGESGAIKAIFTIGDRMGSQDRLITVTTDDPSAQMTTLTLYVDIPDLLTYSTRMLYWMVGGTLDEKPVDISAQGDNRITAIGVKEIVPKQATAWVEPVQPSVKYRLFIKPITLDQPHMVAVTVVASFEGGIQHSFVIYALVR